MLPKDELTGVFTRAQLLPKFEAACALASQSQQSVALIYFDIDRMTRVNNTYGHVAGDEVIKAVAETLGQVFNQDDQVVGRYSGEEFLVVVPGLALEQTTALIEQARQEVEKRVVKLSTGDGSVQVSVTISAGLAFYPKDGVTTRDLLRKADEAMMRAKDAKGNRFIVYAEAEELDGLTGVLKRYGILCQFDKAAEQADRERGSVSLICVDIDEFMNINKQYGRYTGDEVLRRVANIFVANFKNVGTIGRYGGDEFVVVLPNSRAEMAFILAEEARKAVEDTEIVVQVGEVKTRCPVRISGGIAEYPSDANERLDLFRKADEALYRAKQLGRNRICLPVSSQMVTKTSHFTQTQLEKLATLAKKSGKSEASLLREALDDLLRRYEAN